jgi:hypothetical protein
MKKFVFSLFVAFSVGMVGCAGTTGTDGTTSGGGNCTSDSQCAATEACNTVGHVCLTKCTAGSDCPDSAKNCLAVPGGTATVCQCSTDQLCGGGTSFCNTTDKKCEVKCSDNSGCQEYSPARTCNTATGSCVAAATGDCTTNAALCTTAQYCDATTKACVTKCTSDASCGTGNTCDLTTGICGTASNTCTGENTQATCNYGDVCIGSQCLTPNACSAVSNPPAITAAHSPVIFNVARTGSTRTDTNCVSATTGDPLQIVQFGGNFYDPDSDMTSTDKYNHVKWVSASGATNLTYENVTVDATAHTFTFELCGPSSSIQAGAIIIDQLGNKSNTACLP